MVIVSKRILHLLSDEIDPAARSRLYDLLNRFRDDRFEIDVLCLGQTKTPLHPTGDFRSQAISTCWKIDPRAHYRLRHQISDLRPDLIHHWDRTAAVHGLLASGRSRSSVATVVESTALVSHRNPTTSTWLARCIRRMAIGRTSAVIARSETECSHCTAAGLPACRIRLIAPSARPFESSSTAVDLRSRLHIPPDACLIAAFGPEDPGVNLKNVIWAFDVVQLIRDKVHLVIVNSGPHNHRLKQFRDDLDICESVHFLDRDLDCPEVGQLIRRHVSAVWSADVRPMVGGWLPRTLASGIAVIAAQGHETSEMIRSGSSGFLVPPGDRAGYIRITGALLDDESFRREIGRTAKASMRERYSTQSMIDRHVALYEELLGIESVAD